ncbi:hypothetical protein [Mycolicibacterium austroafricanum]|uniref:hypothetical protein n=1 Tax=Mycolicibacterium austroafricanum TaxID=39687 RepID=UPI000CFA46DE|nr:hypothetical protein [Mycolicibacterium austroafricanum]PQP43694.1 hypothetical protein C6A88_23705 [Mycolicibacterium austroafricanum]
MQIDTDSWQKMHNKLGASGATPPTPVYIAVYALTRGAGIDASYALQELRESSTVWRNWVLTDGGLLAHTELEFAAENYDSYAEDGLRRGNPSGSIEAIVRQGWVRRLDTVTSLQIDAVGRLMGFRLSWLPVGDIKLTFADGAEAILPGQMRLSQQDWEWSDRFINTLRDRVQL